MKIVLRRLRARAGAQEGDGGCSLRELAATRPWRARCMGPWGVKSRMMLVSMPWTR